jgi:acyl-CoA dehydrogenase
MGWDFATEPEFEVKLQWMREFVRQEVFPIETLDLNWHQLRHVARPLQEEVKRQGLWAAHLPPELGGHGFGQVKLGLMHEIAGQSPMGPLVFGNNAPDSGNAELLAIGVESNPATAWQRGAFLEPLLDGRMRSAFCMTEPTAGADPTLLSTRAVRDGGDWVISGHKWFSTHASVADFLIVMAVTDDSVPAYEGISMILVEASTPGVDVLRDIPSLEDDPAHALQDFGRHSEIVFRDVRVPAQNLIGREGKGFDLAQQRLGPGRIHHCMRWLGQCRRALDMLCERAVSRFAFGSMLSEKQTVQNWVADSVAEMSAARLMTLHAAWKMDTYGQKAARDEIAMIKYFGAQVLYNVIDRAIQVHGSLGYSGDLPLESMYRYARGARIYDGPDEVHRMSVARHALRAYQPVEVPTEHIPTRRVEAQKRFAGALEEIAANL